MLIIEPGGAERHYWRDLWHYRELFAIPTVKAIYTEVSLKEMYEGARLYSDYRRWLEGQGFEVAAEDLRWVDMGNVLLVRPDNPPTRKPSSAEACPSGTSAGVAYRP